MGQKPTYTQCLVFAITLLAAVLFVQKDINVRVSEMDSPEGNVDPMQRGVQVLMTYRLAHGRLCVSRGTVIAFKVSFGAICISCDGFGVVKIPLAGERIAINSPPALSFCLTLIF